MKVLRQVSFEDTSIAFSSKSDKELKKMFFLFRIMNYSWLVNLGTNLLKLALKLRLPVKPLIKATIFKQFCGGESIMDCREKSLELSNYNIGTILDFSVEGTEDEEDFDRTEAEVLDVVDKSGIEPKNPYVVFKMSGLASNYLLEKIQLQKKLSDEEVESWQRTKNRVRNICQSAYNNEVRVLIDAEESWIQDPVDSLVYEMMQEYNRSRAMVFNTYQMYRKDMYGNLQQAYRVAVENKYHLGVKLVRGAYMEKERERAEEMGYEDPIQNDRKATDSDFDHGLEFCVNNIVNLELCCGSHNEQSNKYLTKLMDQHGLDCGDSRIYFAQLYGMSDNISFNLANAGYNVAKYLPYGPVKEVMPYLIRRAEENTAISGQTSREFLLIKKELARRSKQTTQF
jgi:proline dehydrogenase